MEFQAFKVANTSKQRMSVKGYSYEPMFAPPGKTVLQANIMQREDDYAYWKSLDKEAYRKEKERLSRGIMKTIIKSFSELNGHIELLDSWTPITYERYCNSFHIYRKNFRDIGHNISEVI